jgi:AraC-like DNA-binding protein
VTPPATITEADVRTALNALREHAAATGRRPSVLALAQRLGMANTTLRRRFPAICTKLVAGAVATDQAAHTAVDTTTASLRQENARLRRDNENLTANLEVAIANIQRLTLQAHSLQEALESARGVTRLPRQSR